MDIIFIILTLILVYWIFKRVFRYARKEGERERSNKQAMQNLALNVANFRYVPHDNIDSKAKMFRIECCASCFFGKEFKNAEELELIRLFSEFNGPLSVIKNISARNQTQIRYCSKFDGYVDSFCLCNEYKSLLTSLIKNNSTV